MYSKVWTQFETQSLAFSILRKNLYPKYLVRGELGKIRIYLPDATGFNPELMMTVEVLASPTKDQENSTLVQKGYLRITGGTAAYNVLELLKPHLDF